MVPVREWRGHNTGLAAQSPHRTLGEFEKGWDVETHHEWRKAMSVDGLALCNRHRTEGPPVVRALHRDDVLLASDAAHHLERTLDRL
jgi:hypothetical protein